MKKVAQFPSHTQAFLTSQMLLSRGIKSEIIGTRDYSSIIVGSDEGRYDLLVHWSDETETLRILKEIEAQTVADTNETPRPAATHLKKSITHALLACVLVPIVFNYASLKALGRYWDAEPDKNKRVMGALLVILLQLPTFVFLYYLIKTMNTDFSELVGRD